MRSELERLQSDRLVALVRRLSAVDTPHWRAKLSGVDPARIRSIGDITELPFTTKQEFRDTFPFGMLAVPRSELVRVHASSGTSGKPTVVGFTREDLDVFAECNARALVLAGARGDDVIHVAYGYGLFTGGLGLHGGVERLGATAVPASAGNTAFQIQLLADLGATGLCCTPSFALLLAERAAASGLLDSLRVRFGVLGAEPWSEGMRARIERAWGGEFRAFDIYGLSEVMGPGVASESATQPGALEVFEDHFFPEVVDPQSGKPLPAGELGELVLTTLTRVAQPVLRFRTGDLTRLLAERSADRGFRRIGRLEGRVDDLLIIRGVNVAPREVEAVLLSAEELGGQYIIVVDRRATLHELRVEAELAASLTDRERERCASTLAERMRERLRLRVQVELVAPGGLARQETGKARRVFVQDSDAPPRPA